MTTTGVAPTESDIGAERREALRVAALAKLSKHYSPTFHLLAPPVFGGLVVAACVALMRDVGWRDLWWAPLFYVFANAAEWRIHKSALHKRSALVPVLYDRHTPQHHMLYVTHAMAMKDVRERALVLIPPYGAVALALALAPVAAFMWWAFGRNPALVFLSLSMAYYVSYEILHWSFHLPPSHPVARLRFIRFLANSHSVHHDPRIMQRWNMNVTVPLWDVVRRTYASSADEALAREGRGSTTAGAPSSVGAP